MDIVERRKRNNPNQLYKLNELIVSDSRKRVIITVGDGKENLEGEVMIRISDTR